MTCDTCAAPAVVFLPGSAPVVEVGVMLSRGAKDRHWCLACATARGWPWLVSEAAPRRRRRDAAA